MMRMMIDDDYDVVVVVVVCRNKEVESLKRQIELMKYNIAHEEEKATELEIKSK